MWQVFRTYNASITLDALLNKESTATTIDEKKAEYDRANKEVSSLLHCTTPVLGGSAPVLTHHALDCYSTC